MLRYFLLHRAWLKLVLGGGWSFGEGQSSRSIRSDLRALLADEILRKRCPRPDAICARLIVFVFQPIPEQLDLQVVVPNKTHVYDLEAILFEQLAQDVKIERDPMRLVVEEVGGAGGDPALKEELA